MLRGLTKLEKRNIEKKASELLKRYGYIDGQDKYIDSVKIARSLGFIVGESKKLPDQEDGFIFVHPDNDLKIIAVNNNRSSEDKRFIVAHEIGHFILHNKSLDEQFMLREHIKGKNSDENDADYFAACLLMPYNSFKEEASILRNIGYDEYEIISKLQAIFHTNQESIKRRLEEVHA